MTTENFNLLGEIEQMRQRQIDGLENLTAITNELLKHIDDIEALRKNAVDNLTAIEEMANAVKSADVAAPVE